MARLHPAPSPRSGLLRNYRALPDYLPHAVDVMSGRNAWMLALGDAVFAAALFAPPVQRATGVPRGPLLAVIALHLVWLGVVARLLTPRAPTARWAYYATFLGHLAFGFGSTMLLVAGGGDPSTPMWMFPVAYAAMNGALQEARPTYLLLGLHTAAPLLAIPWFHATAPGDAWSLAGPVVAAVTSACVYHLLSANGQLWTELRRDRDDARRALRQKEAELARTVLARELHDSVGSALSLAAMYGDLVERHAEDPKELRRVAGLVRAAGKEGLGELRAVLAAVAPAGESAAALGASLHALAARMAEAAGVRIDLAVEGEPAQGLEPPVRLALVRVFQESLTNAVRHGHPTRIDVALRMSAGEAVLEVRDDGVGFAPGSAGPLSRGLAGMRARTAELGGVFELAASPGAGTRVRCTLPLEPGLAS